MKNKKQKIVFVDIKGGAVQYTSVPRGVKLIVRDFDNCPDCGTEFCNGDVENCPKANSRSTNLDAEPSK